MSRKFRNFWGVCNRTGNIGFDFKQNTNFPAGYFVVFWNSKNMQIIFIFISSFYALHEELFTRNKIIKTASCGQNTCRDHASSIIDHIAGKPVRKVKELIERMWCPLSFCPIHWHWCFSPYFCADFAPHTDSFAQFTLFIINFIPLLKWLHNTIW